MILFSKMLAAIGPSLIKVCGFGANGTQNTAFFFFVKETFFARTTVVERVVRIRKISTVDVGPQ